MIVRPHRTRADWFTWSDPPFEWYHQFADEPLPGLVFGTANGRTIVDFHTTHLPCLPVDVAGAAAAFPPADPPPLATALLRPYQLDVVNRFGGFRGALLAMEMRTGKTPTACHMHDPTTGPLIIAGPLAAREAWRDWVGRVFSWPLCCLSTLDASDNMPGFPVYFCHYEILEAHAPFLQRQGIGTLILDEIHYLQGKYSRRVQAVALLTACAKKILGLSGTPVWNKPKSLWQLLHLLTPGAWGTAFEFKRRYCGAEPGAYGWTYEGITNEEELRARLACMTARLTWKDVEPDLPLTTRVFEPVSLTGAQYAALEAAAMKATLARGTSSAAGYFATLRRKAGMLKIKPAVEAALRAVEDGHKVVLWVWHNEVGDRIEEDLRKRFEFDTGHYGHWRLQASDNVGRRELIVETFRQATRPTILVASMGVGGVGLDLSCSDCAIFVELDWTPANVYQAEMRTFHKDRPHSVTYFYTDDPVESRLITALDAKNGFAGALGLGSEDILKGVLA